MCAKKTIFLLSLAVIGLCVASIPASAATETVVHSFDNMNNQPVGPMGGVIFDAAGNMYGTTVNGGANSDGAMFELTLGANGQWAPAAIYSFITKIGEEPEGTLVFDSAGNLYGTTIYGGSKDQGAVFQLSKTAGGKWTGKILHSFVGGNDGYYPQGPLTIDASGNIYGTTDFGGTHGASCDTRGCGVVYELTPGANGVWSETVLHSFQRNTHDGAYPNGGVVLDSVGNLYGTTELGGAHSSGTVFQMSFVGGSWTENVLYNFCSSPNCTDGSLATSALTFDSSGNLYGTTQIGGASCGPNMECGTVFQLSPGANNTWTESVLYNFCSAANCADGAVPGVGRLIFDALGNLYGTTGSGGAYGTSCSGYGCGTVFELTPQVGGAWTENVLFSFTPNGVHGTGVAYGLALDAAGNLYGTTYEGGKYGAGTVFKVTPYLDSTI